MPGGHLVMLAGVTGQGVCCGSCVGHSPGHSPGQDSGRAR